MASTLSRLLMYLLAALALPVLQRRDALPPPVVAPARLAAGRGIDCVGCQPRQTRGLWGVRLSAGGWHAALFRCAAAAGSGCTDRLEAAREHGFMTQTDVIILGAGAAGLFAAGQAGQRGLRVALLEKADAPGKKILISGGGRCNFTNIGASPRNFLSANPHFAKSALARYSPADFIALVERHGIAWHEKTLGQLFCDGSAKQIVAMLLDECPADRVSLTCGVEILQVERSNDGSFTVTAADGRIWRAPALVIATGGPSIPKMGASDFAYRLARQFGLKVVEPRPALVPLTLGGEDALFRELSGVAAPVLARAGTGKHKTEFAEAALFHPQGAVRPGHPASLKLLAAWRRRRHHLCARGRKRLADRGQTRPPAHASAHHSARSLACAAGRCTGGSAGSGTRAWQCLGQGTARRTGATGRTGALPPTAQKASPRPKSLPAGSPPPNFPAARWKPPRFPGFTPSARRWMSPAGSAVTTSSGPGRAVMPAPRPLAAAPPLRTIFSDQFPRYSPSGSITKGW